jgi:hypothetical protein
MSAGDPPAGNDTWTMGTLPLDYMSESGIHVAKSRRIDDGRLAGRAEQPRDVGGQRGCAGAPVAHAIEPRRVVAVVMQQRGPSAAGHPQRTDRVPACGRDDDAFRLTQPDPEPPERGAVLLVFHEQRRRKADERGRRASAGLFALWRWGLLAALSWRGIDGFAREARGPRHTQNRLTGTGLELAGTGRP